MKRCSTLVIEKCKLKLQDTAIQLLAWLILKSVTKTKSVTKANVGEYVEQLELIY